MTGMKSLSLSKVSGLVSLLLPAFGSGSTEPLMVRTLFTVVLTTTSDRILTHTWIAPLWPMAMAEGRVQVSVLPVALKVSGAPAVVVWLTNDRPKGSTFLIVTPFAAIAPLGYE